MKLRNREVLKEVMKSINGKEDLYKTLFIRQDRSWTIDYFINKPSVKFIEYPYEEFYALILSYQRVNSDSDSAFECVLTHIEDLLDLYFYWEDIEQ